MPDQNSLLFKQKQVLRQKMLAQRKALSANELEGISLQAQRHVLALPEWQRAAQVLLYYPVNSELDTTLLIQSAFEQNKKVLLPRCIAGQKGQMELALCPDFSCLVPGQFGIMEPSPDTCPTFYPATDFAVSSGVESDAALAANLAFGQISEGAFSPHQIAILPGLAFCPCGLRLGYGGGYYDRFLNENKLNKFFLLGFGASFQVLDELPEGKWDYPLDSICTENGVIRCSKQ